MNIVNGARSVDKGRHTAWVARGITSNAMTLKGDIRWATNPVKVAIHDPAEFFGAMVERHLVAAGVSVRTSRVAAIDEDVPGGETILAIETPMELVMRRVVSPKSLSLGSPP